jgi:hypothetical protein
MATILNAIYGAFLDQFFARDAQVCGRLMGAVSDSSAPDVLIVIGNAGPP